MTDVPARASAVVIGAGIVGNSLVHHLALLGWKDIVLVDKGPLPNPGGSTGHASNFIFPIEYSRLMFELTRDSTEQYKALGVFTESGGIEVARTPERMQELKRRITKAKAWGIPAEHLTPEGVQKLVPYLDPSVILGGGYFPTVGVVDSLRAGTLMREQAQADGALTVVSGAEVLDITTDAGRVTGIVTSKGEIATDNVVICCGVWSTKVAALAGARLALTPIVHQMISVGPIGLFAGTTGEISYPIVRDVDEGMYERQHGGDMEVGSYMHRPIIVPPETIPSNEQAVLSPTEMPFTADDFDPQLAAALELMPELLGDEKAGIRYAINGLISMTPDGHPLLGETPEGQGQGRPRLRPGRRRADVRPGADRRRARGRRRPLLPLVPDDRLRPRPGRRGVQQDVRHRAPRRAVRVAARAADRPALRAGAGPRRRVLRDRPLGT